MSSINFGIMQFQHQITIHRESKQHQIFARHSATVRPKRTTRGSFGGRRKQTIKSMRAVVQRVASASVEVEGRTVSAIGPGLLVLVGLHETDVEADAEYICRKVLNMRLFPNEKTGKTWDQNVISSFSATCYPCSYNLTLSQFTLYGVLKGNKPDFHVAMPPEAAKPFYTSLVEKIQKAYRVDAVKDGVFGAKMKVNLVNDGPVTMQLDSAQTSKNANDVV
ncbi:UNVERIFIED_CONTAM: D-aminoacyl-tRNA deacylase [Sesamum latifolium]|uniref:D-aminoacyl-tRNA deacylase n=1 Tax=Sesamum latifolium TaxID=2727402 RepID=A0AAW2WQA1_9LAMI